MLQVCTWHDTLHLMKNKRDFIYGCSYDSPLGKMVMKSFDGEKLSELFFEGQKYFNEKEEAKRFESAKYGTDNINMDFITEKSLPVFSETKRWLNLYFAGKNPSFTPPLDLRGTDFRLDVWQMLLKIPYGKTATYGDIAVKIAKKRGMEKMSSRAVGGAVGHNPVAIIVPCHRVVGTGGNLTGYGGGIKRKVELLKIEHIDVTHDVIQRDKQHCKH